MTEHPEKIKFVTKMYQQYADMDTFLNLKHNFIYFFNFNTTPINTSQKNKSNSRLTDFTNKQIHKNTVLT